jgi:prophage regulatory protein
MFTKAAPADETRFLRLPEVMNRVGLAKTKIYAMIKDEDFPPPIKLGRASVWPEARIKAWQSEKMRG